MTFRLAQANVCQPDSALDTARTVHTVTAHADVATFNEANDPATHSTIRHLPGWDSYLPAHAAAREDCIAWRADAFRCLHRGSQVVMRGGIVHGRRRGPSRAVSWVVLQEAATDATVTLATHHDIAKGDTKGFRWRRPLRSAGFEGVSRALAKVVADYGAPLILTGDLNAVGRVRLRGLRLREVHTPATYGRKRYDRILADPGMTVRDVHTLRTRSDHLALTALVTLEKP